MTPAVMDTDLLLDSLGSATPPVLPNDWDKLAVLLVEWREAIEAEPMPEWVTV
jgi:hypothetical protein